MAYYRDMESAEHEIPMQAWISCPYTSHRVRGNWNCIVNVEQHCHTPLQVIFIAQLPVLENSLHPGFLGVSGQGAGISVDRLPLTKTNGNRDC
jgi:hypothetical protein